MGQKLLDRYVPTNRSVFGIEDDFDHYVTVDTWTTVASNSGTITVSDGAGGIVKIDPSSDGGDSQADNDESYITTTTEMFKFAAGKPLVFEARIRPVANTIASINVMVGLIDAVAADSIQDAGAGPDASYSGAVFFKEYGETAWACESSIAGTQTTVRTNKTVANNTWTDLRIEFHQDIGTTSGTIHFFVDDEEVGEDVTTSPGNKIAQTVLLASATEMDICLGVKAGAANDSEYLDADYVSCFQQR